MKRRWVLHLDMDAFFASVEQLTRPTLRERPVLVGGTSGRGVVAGASYQARKLGAHSAMPMHQAKKLVGYRGIIVAPRHSVYTVASRRVFEIVRKQAGLIEQVSIDEAFVEPDVLQGASVAEVTAWAEQLRQEIAAVTGLMSSIGAGGGKQAAKIGSGLAKPNGVYVIPKEREAEILGPLPVRKLWGIGPVAETKLHRYGVETIAEFANLQRGEVEQLLGKTVGVGLWLVANGIDTAAVEPRSEAKSVGAEFTYSHDLLLASEVQQALEKAFVAAIQRLRKDGRGARTVSVKLKTADFRVNTRSQTLLYASDDANVLKAMADALVQSPADLGAIRLVGVSFSNLEMPSQTTLFPETLIQHNIVAEDQQLDQFLPRQVESEVPDLGDPVQANPVLGISGRDQEDRENREHREHRELRSWRNTEDVYHAEYGHGWVQGSGHGIVTVRFETRTTEKSFSRTFPIDTDQLVPADPVASLEWDDYLATRSSTDAADAVVTNVATNVGEADHDTID